MLLNDAPEVEGLRRIAETHRRHGTTGLFPTLISDHPAVTRRAIDAARAARHAGVPGVLGLHLEGPFLNPERSGIHPPDRLRRGDETDRRWLQQQAADLPLIMTLAPECVPGGIHSRAHPRGHPGQRRPHGGESRTRSAGPWRKG
ncbi:MAG: hypothetical protein U5L11_05085 [Arhodomonas sp.]|nr:hypothetical protein [Arhodomonas sp.]